MAVLRAEAAAARPTLWKCGCSTEIEVLKQAKDVQDAELWALIAQTGSPSWSGGWSTSMDDGMPTSSESLSAWERRTVHGRGCNRTARGGGVRRPAVGLRSG